MDSALIIAGTKPRHSPESSQSPRVDYQAIAQVLNARILENDLPNDMWSRVAANLEKRLKVDFRVSLRAYRTANNYSAILSLSEKSAIPVAMLMRLNGLGVIPHIVIAHKLSSGNKTLMLRWFRTFSAWSHVICVCKAQAQYATDTLGLPPSKVSFVYDKVDDQFFVPANPGSNPGNYILAVGQEQRDYQTLLTAIQGTGIDLIVVASSPWSSFQTQLQNSSSVKILHGISFTDLLGLYQGARIVVVPLHEVSYAAGVNALLEAMSVAKPVIVTRTQGIMDYIEDKVTGRFVKPMDSEELRDMIRDLWDRPNELRLLGTNARQVIDEKINFNNYVERVAQIVCNQMTQAARI